MVTFGNALEQAAQSGKFVFPIGLPTFFELDSMTSPETRAAVTELADELSQGFCIVPYHERVRDELRKLRSGTLEEPDAIEDFLCSPIELLGIPVISLPAHVTTHVDQNTFNKAFYDTLSELPFSIQLEVAGSSSGAKWDNARGIADMNEGKDAHQADITNLNTGIGIELKALIQAWFAAEEIDVSPKDIGLYALNALYHWNQNPTSRALPTLRILSSLYGLMRFDSQRRYRAGDPNDFMVAASALPVAHALFTDRKLANFLADPRIHLVASSDCTIVSGFDEMAKYLADQL